MNADHLSYNRAVSVSIFGLAIQGVLGITILLYGVLGDDPAAVSGALAMLLGVPVWIALALVFNQHKLERLEALEAEAYASSAAARAAVFERSTDELVQKGRLDWMHRWFLPAVSLLVGASLLILGLFRFFNDRPKTTFEGFVAPPASGWAIALGIGVGVLGFVLARFVAGMAKQPVWSLLRAGSAASVGCTVVAAALAVAHFANVVLGNDAVLRLLPIVVDVYMIVLGVEVFANFLLVLYLPRKPGEYVRPAFDSRILAFVAAPDRLAQSISEAFNYQFGFDVGSTWFYKLVARSIGGLVLLGGLIVWGMTCIAIVEPNEKALLLVNGKLSRTIDASGPVFKAPWPFAQGVRFPATSVNALHVGAEEPTPGKPILWTNAHAGGGREFLMIVQPTPAEGAGGAGRDFELLVAEFPIRYRVRDLEQYIRLAQDGPADDPDLHRRALLQAEASSVVIEEVARYNVDELLGGERPRIAAQLKVQIQRSFDALAGGAGVDVLFVGLSGVHPNKDVADSFEAAVRADQDRETEIQRAMAFRIERLADVAGDVDRANEIVEAIEELNRVKDRDEDSPDVERLSQRVSDLLAEAGGEAATLIERAKAARWSAVLDVRADAIRTEGLAEIYHAAPEWFRVDRQLDAIRRTVRGAKVIFTSFDDLTIEVDATEQYVDVSGWTTTQDEE